MTIKAKREQLPIVVVVGMLCYNDHILMGKSKGLYIFPGGKVKWHETIADALKREILEETGITIKNWRFRQIFDRISEDEHWIVLLYEIDNWEGEIENKEPDKIEEWQWHYGFRLPPVEQWNETLKMCREAGII